MAKAGFPELIADFSHDADVSLRRHNRKVRHCGCATTTMTPSVFIAFAALLLALRRRRNS